MSAANPPPGAAPPAGAGDGSPVDVTVVYAAPGVEAIVRVALPPGAVVGDALAASGLLDRLALDPRTLACAIYGERVPVSLPLREGDRVELTRPLVIDAKEARRRRAAARPLPRSGQPTGPSASRDPEPLD